MYERAVAILPMVGSGSWDNPKRPLFAPIPSQMKSGDRSGIIAFHYILSDDGKFALVEIVAASKKDLAPLVAQMKAQAGVAAGAAVFESGASQRSSIENAFKAKRKDFDLDRFQVVLP